MNERGFFESRQQGDARKVVVQVITKVCEDWIRDIFLAEPMLAAKEPCEHFQLHAYGSYRLDAHLPNADIDTVVIVSKFINREEHFPLLHACFESFQRQHPGRLESLKFITSARVPIISFYLDGIDIDIGFSQTNLTTIEADFVACDAILENMERRCKTSINGKRVTDAIAMLLPDEATFEANIVVFRTVIRFLKHWAKRRCVYGNKEGLLMGVALEVMLVLVCQLYPNYSEFDILHKFFAIFAQWPWADESKGIVIITELHEVTRAEAAYEYGGPWTKESPICRKQAMKIITPCYPQANTTSKVSNLQLLAIKTELFRGWALTQKIIDSRGPKQAESMSCFLDELLSPFNFFDRYTHYAVIKASAETQDSFISLKEEISMSVAGGRSNLIQLMEAEKGTHVDIAHPLPVWVLDRGDDADAVESIDSADAGMKRERSCSDDSSPLVRRDPLKAVYFVGLSLKDECRICQKDVATVFFTCPIKALLASKKVELPFEGPLQDRQCANCKKKYRKHTPKIKDLGLEFDKVCDKYTNQLSFPKRRTYKQGQNVSISIKTGEEMQMYAWVKSSDEILKHGRDLGELKDGGEDDDLVVPPLEPPTLPNVVPPSEPPVVDHNLFETMFAEVHRVPDTVDSKTETFKLKPNQELRFEVKAENNQQARRTTAVLVLQQGLAEICGAELAEGREYEFRDAALIGVFSYHGCTLSLSGCYHVVQPDAISQPVPMTFIACLHAQLQSARESARAAAESAASTLTAVPAFSSLNPAMSGPLPPNAAAVGFPSRVNPPRVMIAGGEKSGKSAVAKILANYAVRMDQKPLLVDLDCAGGLSNVPGSICAATMTRVIPPVSSGVSQPWHRAPLAFFVAHEKPDTNPDAFLSAVTYMGVAIKNRIAALQSIDPVAASSGLIVDAFRCDDYETSATLLVNAAIALSISHLVLTKDDMHMVSIFRSKAPDIKVVTLPPFTEFKRRMGRACDSWAVFSELKIRSYFRGDYEMALEPEVGFTLSGEALRLCGFYHVLPLQKLRVSQGSLPMGEKAADKSDAIVEKKRPDATMQGRVMAVLNCEEGFVVTAENYCRIPVLGYIHVRSWKGGKLEITKPASSFLSKHPTFVFGSQSYSE